MLINLLLSVIILGSLGIWAYLFFILKRSFNLSPNVNETDNSDTKLDLLVSVIIPARNEEKYIQKCISSLLHQSSKRFELILVDDNSTDNTLNLIEHYKDDPRVRIIKAGEKPLGWIGKNWPCFVGYSNSKGKYLLFTDADTIHSNHSIRDSVNTLITQNLDVLTAVPNLIYPNFIIKMVLPVLSIFMFSRYSPMRVNDPRAKVGYVFGSFFVISRKSYEKVGTHESVKSEIVEDGALGKKLKEEGYKLKMFRGENLLEAYWARDFGTLWNSLKRLIVPLYFTDRKNSVFMTIGIFFLMVFPFLVLIYSFIIFYNYNHSMNVFDFLLMGFSIASVSAIFLTNFYQLQKAKTHKTIYCLGTPIGCFIISLAFIWSIMTSEKNAKIKWRDREYNYNKGMYP